MFDCILLVAGKSTRFNQDTNKVLYKLKDKLVFRYSLELFLSIEECRKVVLVTSKNDIDIIKNEVKDLDLNKIIFTTGGVMRQDSVYNGLMLTESDIVLIHDGARPMINANDILKVYHESINHLAATLAVKVIDTIKQVDDKVITLNRANLWQIQTPQGVNRKIFLDVITKAKNNGYYGTDDVSLIEKYTNIQPKMVEGNYDNIKITTFRDIKYLEFLMDGNYGL